MALRGKISQLRRGGGSGEKTTASRQYTQGGSGIPPEGEERFGGHYASGKDVPQQYQQTPEDIEDVTDVSEMGPQRNLTAGTTWAGGGGYTYKMEEGGKIRIVSAPPEQKGAEGFLVDASNPNLKKAYDAIVEEWSSGEITPVEEPAPLSREDLLATASRAMEQEG